MTTLSDKLFYEASAPMVSGQEFNRFVVGHLREVAQQFMSLVDDMLEGKKPSQCRLILGPNGNGKTLLGNMVMAHADELNKEYEEDKRLKEKRLKAVSFKVLFARSTWNERKPEQLGIDFAKELKRTLREPSNAMYASIATKVVANFEKARKPSPWERVLEVVWKLTLKKVIDQYQDALKELVTERNVQDALEVLDKSFDKLKTMLAKRRYRNEF
ncbi:MAG: hypothetical protein JO347_04695, partial [Candidatus Eremiobacteraeota bacterium]|nr:hypothetical protein [Candidatus Eremiobacteraeota bacterium]